MKWFRHRRFELFSKAKPRGFFCVPSAAMELRGDELDEDF
jgi:hypothetical protein